GRHPGDRVPPAGRTGGAGLRGARGRGLPARAPRRRHRAPRPAGGLVRPVRRLRPPRQGLPRRRGRGRRRAGTRRGRRRAGRRGLMDRTLLFVQVALGALGVVGVAAGEPSAALEQASRVALALGLTVVVSRLSPRAVTRLSPYLFRSEVAAELAPAAGAAAPGGGA